MNAIWEPLLAIVLAITNFSIQPNPKAPDGAAALEHAVDEADVIVHLDVKATVGNNYPTFRKLADDPQVKQAPELAAALRDAVTQIDGGRAMARNVVGFDFVDDVGTLTAFVRMPPGGGQPDFLVVVRGNLPADLPSKLPGARIETIAGRPAAAMPDGTLVGFAKGGALLAGKREWVEPRLGDAWKPAPRARGSAWAQIGASLDKKPFFLVASKPTPDAAAFLAQQVSTASFGRDLIVNHTLAVVAATSTGLHWTYQAKDAAFAARVKTASEGVIELMRAGHVVPRGVADLAAAALPSYAGTSPGIDGAIKHRDKLLAAVDDLTGDGKFASTVKVTGSVVTVETKAKRISDVVPTGTLMAFAAIGFVSTRAEMHAPAGAASGSVKPVKPTPPRPVAPRPAPAKPAKPSGGAPAKKPALAL